MRVSRIAYREFSKNPDLSMSHFKSLPGREVFGDKSSEQHVADLLMVQQYFRLERSWALPSPVVEPLRVKHFAATGQLPEDRKADLKQAVENMRAMAKRYAGGKGSEGELAAAAKRVADQW